jgi:hypothetical protein
MSHLSRQSTRFFLQSSELGPHPLSRQASIPPPLIFGWWGGGTHLLGGEGGGPNSDEGTDTCDTINIYVLCALHCIPREKSVFFLGPGSYLQTHTVQYYIKKQEFS